MSVYILNVRVYGTRAKFYTKGTQMQYETILDSNLSEKRPVQSNVVLLH